MSTGVLGEQEVARLCQLIPAATWERLFPYQRKGVDFGLRHGGRLLLADEMGLGKTCQVRAVNRTRKMPAPSEGPG